VPTVEFKQVDVIFAADARPALEMLDAGRSRDEILSATGAVVGAADANVQIQAGQMCVLMGLSGSGKSTLLRCVNGLNTASRGEVLVQDGDGYVDIPRADNATLRRLRTERIAMVFQQFALLPWRTVRENVGFGLEIRGLPAAEIRRVVDRQLELVHLEQWADKYAHELSGGMQQRVGLARAFATDADILLMDEPFSALDPLIRERLQDELLDLQRTLQKTIIFVSHDLDEAIKIGNHVAIMEDARIVQQGTPQDIVLNPSTDYVAQFVANMNPLRVLSAETTMVPLASGQAGGDELRIETSAEGGVQITQRGRALLPRPVHALEDDAPWPSDSIGVAAPDTAITELIRVRHLSGLPVLVMDDGRPVGLVDDSSIYAALCRQGKP
jgi:glycine betaine/proline transport system ATP-binding protein